MYRFEKYGTLWWYHGIPVRVGGKIITKHRLAVWWPVNWLGVLIVGPYFLVKGIIALYRST